jgi:hypothetical protein
VLSEEVIHDVVTLASRAPSVHNIQPARWRFHDDSLTLFKDIGRCLPVADPTGHDVDMSLGAAFEGMCLALSQVNLALNDIAYAPDEYAAHCAPVLRATMREGVTEDPLATHVVQRRSFRGTFAPVSDRDVEMIRTVEADDAIVVGDRPSVGVIARAHDLAAWRFESNPAYHEELWAWLRLSSRASFDGLTADCLALSDVERVAARALLAPAVFRQLSRAGIARKLISEAAQVNSASALVVFAPPRGATAFDAGRRFYRLWLELTAFGFFAVPMSASADDPETNAAIARLVDVPGERRIANVLRVGRTGDAVPAVSPRIPASDLLV